MNCGLKLYGIMLVMITTLIFTLNFGVVNATTTTSSSIPTTSINPNNSTQSNPLTELNSDSGDASTCDNCVSNNNNNNNNNDDEGNNRNDNNDNDDNNNDDDNNNNNNNNDDGRSSSSDDGDDDVPMSLPFNSNLADESDDEKDYSNAIPFP